MRKPVAQTLGMRTIDIGGDGINAPAIGYLALRLAIAFEHNTSRQYIVHLIKGDFLILHLTPYTIWRFDARFYLIFDTSLVKSFANGCSKLGKQVLKVSAHLGQSCLDQGVLLGVLIAEGEVFQFLLNLIQAQSVGQGRIDVERFARNLVLLGWRLTT